MAVQAGENPTSGVGALDALIDGVRVGDNLVMLLDDDLPGGWVVQRFAAAADPSRLIVADATGDHASAGGGGEVLDWSSAGEGPITPEHARAQLEAADRRVGRDAAFAFDSLSALAEAWGDDAALDLFLWACPRLYRRGSVALWVVQRGRHDDAFLRRLTEITQVVVMLQSTATGVMAEVRKADGRPRAVQGRRIEARLVDGDLIDVRSADAQRQRLAESLRALRISRGIGQAELARRVGISPSALSQAERGVRGVSAETLTSIWEALGVPFGPGDPLARGYRVNRRSGQAVRTLGAGVSGRQLADDPRASVWWLTVQPRAGDRSALFHVKATETITVLRGVLQLELATDAETLHEGDALTADGTAITAWSNPSDTVTELIWLITT